MQSLLEYEAEERRYQSFPTVEVTVEGIVDTDETPSPPSYTAEATTTPWIPHEFLPQDSEVACGVPLDSIPEDVLGAPTDYETSAVHDSDLDSEGTLADMSLVINESAQATGVSFRARPVHWVPSPIAKARELIESSPRSQFTHRRAGNSRQSSHHSNTARGRSGSWDSTASRRPSGDHPLSRVGSRQNSDSTNRHHGSQMPASSRTVPNGEGSPRFSLTSRRSSVLIYNGDTMADMHPTAQADVPQTTTQAPAHSIIDDASHGRTTHVYPPTYSPNTIVNPDIFERSIVPPNTPEPSNWNASTTSPQHTMGPQSQRPSPSTGTPGVPARGPRNGAFYNVYMHANYSNPTIYPNIVSAAGLNYGTPFGSPMAFAPATVPPMSPRAPLGQMPVPSRNSTGNFPFHTALDAMQSPSLGPVPVVPVDGGAGTSLPGTAAYVDIETFAAVQRNISTWKPAWDVFPLKVYRGYDLKVIEIQRDWDDEDLLRELGVAYNKLRGRLWKYFSIMDVWYVTMVAAERQYVFPQRVGPAKISAHRNMRMRYLLAHPEHMKGQCEIMRALTARRDYGVEFVERPQTGRMTLFTCGFVVVALAIAIVYGVRTGDWPGAFGIGAFFGQSFALPVGMLQVAVASASTSLMHEW
ncbi:hypothetical protein LXA43DRAFT_362118 [Ganoderma leucocontextum]|nr:hypothetical protein LXA43DRAFT_362118 [Ganoderma leucocontextum]